jgi:hypothetical protein
MTGEKTFILEADRGKTWLFFPLPQSEELAEIWLEWTEDGRTKACCLKLSTYSPENDLKDLRGVWCSLWHL